MTALPRDQDPYFARRRYDIDELKHLANQDMRATAAKTGYTGRILGGVLPAGYGILEGMGWVATQAPDGQVDLTLSFRSKRPNNWEVMRAFKTFGWDYHGERSRPVGKVRHFIVQRSVA